MLDAQDWYCVDTKCVDTQGKRSVLGRIVRGELVINGVKANTDGTHVTVMCPTCGQPKTWFAADKKVVAEFWQVISRVMGRLMEVTDGR
jgi:hypothetical protein